MMAVAMLGAFPGAAGDRTTEMVDATLLGRCRVQDPEAFKVFVVEHERMVFALLSRMLGQGPEVEDLAQETFVRAYRAFPTFDPKGPAKASTWLLTIATRLALDSRRKRCLDVRELDEGSDAPTASTPELTLEHRQLGQAIARAAARLPDDQRAALILAELHGLSIAEIAQALEVPENTAKTRLFRAREKMRAALSTEWRTP